MNPDYTMLPEHMREGMKNYIEKGVRPGSFLRAVLENDLTGAVIRADDENGARLVEFVRFLFAYAPASCYGSRVRVMEWCEKRGLLGGAR